MYVQTEKVNIEPKSYLPVFRISQNDVGRTLKAHLVSDEGTIAIPAGATVTMAGIKPSGLGYTVTGTINGSDVTFETDAVMTDEAGQIESEIRIVDGETLIGTTNVVLNIEPNPHPDDVTDGQREPLVNEITALLNQITAQADRTEEYSSKVLNMTVTAHESEEPTVTKTEGEVVNLDFGLPRGEKGERGERGEQGEAGKDGKDGIDGKDGKDGINGVTPDFSIGTVTTLEPTESASVTLTGTEEEPVLNFGIPRGVKGEQGEVSLNDLKKIMVTDSASGSIASFPDGSDLLPAKSLIANIVPKQSGSGTPSPENVRPISGWESVETSVAGKNLLDEQNTTIYKRFLRALGSNNAEWAESNDSASVAVACKPNTTYTITASNSSATLIRAAWVDYNPDDVQTGQTPQAYGLISHSPYSAITITTGTSAKYLIVQCNVALVEAKTAKLQIELGTTATAYEPYTATTHTTSLGRTVYGGTVDLVSGVLTDKMKLIDLGSLSWSYQSTWESWYTDYIADVKGTNTGTETPNFVSDRLEAISTNAGFVPQAQGFTGITSTTRSSSGCRILVKNGSTTEPPTGQLCYELAEPQTYTLTPSTINTLSGVNNVWTDSGDCSIVYYADTKLYIDKKLGGN